MSPRQPALPQLHLLSLSSPLSPASLLGPALRPLPRKSRRPLPQLLAVVPCLQHVRLSRQPPRPRLRRSDSRPDKSYPPSFRQCPEFPSTVPASCPRASRRN